MKKYSSYKDSGESWLGEIPSTWGLKKMKYLFTERSQKGFPFLPLLAATQNHGVIKKEDYENRTVVATKGLETLKLVKPNDFVISLRSFEGGIEISKERGIISPAYTVLIPKEINPKYFKYLGKSSSFINLLKSTVTGIREGQNIDYNKLKNYFLPIPSSEEQTRIANYLDNIIIQIDQAIAQQQKMIDLLNERKQIIIQKAVTKGLDPNVEMKDSGIEWIGEIPSHWKVLHLRNFIRIFSEKGYPNSQLLSVTRDKGVIIRDKDDIEENHNFIPDDLRGYKHLMPGDFVINKMKSWQGSYGVSLYEGIVSPAYFTCKLKGVNKKFFSTAIRSKIYTAFFMQYSKGIRIGQWDLDPASMKNIPFILPPENEQIAITSYLEKPLHLISDEIGQKEKILSLLQERKQIIINDVVTGKVKVC